MSDFLLHERIKQDSLLVTELPLCMVRLMNNKHVPWFLLVPQWPNIQNITDLPPKQQLVLMKEISLVSKAVERMFKPERLNVASIGNKVSQMHWHIAARHSGDLCWPEPVWGKLPEATYAAEAAKSIINDMKEYLGV